MATADLPPALSRAWFAAFLRTFSVAELTAATGRHASLASKFRSGAQLPKAAHLDELAARTGRVEVVIGAIALLEEFADLREAVETTIAGRYSDSEPSEVPVPTSTILNQQLDRRLDNVEGISDAVRAAGSIALVVPDGHGVTELYRRLQLRAPSGRTVFDLSASVLNGTTPDLGELVANRSDITVVVPANHRSAVVRARLPTFEVVSPTWSDIFEEIFGSLPTPPLRRAGGVLFDRLPLALVREALMAYYQQLTSPARLDLTRRAAPANLPEAQSRRQSLSAAQVHVLDHALEHKGVQVWGIVIPTDVDVAAVAHHLSRRSKGSRPFADTGLAGILRAWADIVDASTSALPIQPTVAPVVLEIPHGSPGAGLDALAAIVAMWRERGALGPWYVCGTADAVREVASTFTDELAVIRLPSCPRPTEDDIPRHKPVAIRLLPDHSWFSEGDAARDAWVDDHWQLEQRFALRATNAYIEVPVGQGASLAARALKAMRRELDRSDQAIVSIEDHFVADIDDIADEVLKDAGFLTTRKVGSSERSMVGSPYFRTIVRMNDEERLAAADKVAMHLFGETSMSVELFPEDVLYVDLSPTRYGRLPVGSRNVNKPERLLPAYLTIARTALASVAQRRAPTFVFAPPGLYNVELLPLEQWDTPSVLLPLPGVVLDEIRRRHGLEPLRTTPRLLWSSIATAEVAAAPPPQKNN